MNPYDLLNIEMTCLKVSEFGQSVSSITTVSIINGSYRLIETEVELIMPHPQLLRYLSRDARGQIRCTI